MVAANRKKQVQMWAGILISAVSLGAIFIFINPADILEALRTARYEYLGLTVLGILGFLVMRTIRWRFMLNRDVEPGAGRGVAWLPVFHIQNIGYMLTMILPFRIGDVARAVLIGSVPPLSLAKGLSTMVVERLLDLLFIVTLLPFTLAQVEHLPPEIQTAARLSGTIGIAAILLLTLVANQRALAGRVTHDVLERLPFLDTESWVRRADDLLAGLTSLTRFRDSIILIVLSIITWFPIILAYYASLLAVNLSPTLAMAGFTVCAAALAITVPSSPAQVGVFHAGVTFALVQILGQPAAESASFALLYHAINTVTMIVLGLIGVYGTSSTMSNVLEATQRIMRGGDRVRDRDREERREKREERS